MTDSLFLSPSYTDLKGAFLILIFSGYLQLLQAQEKSFLFSHYSFNDGLYEESVNRLSKDQKGYIWICTENALQRFDGKRFLSFLPGSALPSGVLRDAKMDNKNRLWLLSDDATVGYFDPVSLKYTRINIEMPPASSKIIHQLYTDAQNRVYLVWYKQGFITYTDASRKASAANNPFTLPAEWKPMNIQQDKDQQLWIGTTMGLVKFNPTAKTLSYRDHNTDNDPVITAFASVRETGLFYRDLHDHAWLVSWKDQFILRSLNIKTGQQQDLNKKISQLQQGAYFVPLKFLEYSDGSVWLTGSNLLARIDPEKNTIQLIPPEAPGEYSIRFNHVFDLMEDREKSLWVATNKGLYRFNPASNRFFVVRNRRYTDEKNTVTETTGFLETQNGTLLVSSWGNGLFSYDQQFRPVPFPGISINNLRNTGMVWDILQRKNGDIWLAMQAGALFIYPSGTGKLVQIRPPEVKGSTIRQIEEDQSGNIWLGTHSGDLIRWNAADNTFTSIYQFHTVISKILTDKSNHIWVCTDNAGLHRFSSTGERLNSYTRKQNGKEEGITGTGAADIIQYDDSLFYIASHGLDILNVKTGKSVNLSKDNNLPNPHIYSLQKDNRGYVWMATGAGIVSYHPGLHKMSLYTSDDGVHSYSFETTSSYCFKNGWIAFGTIQDFIVFNPDELTTVHYEPPQVEIAAIEIRGRNYPVDSLLKLPQIELTYEDNAIRLFVSTLRYQDSYTLKYQLEGLDDEWHNVDIRQLIEFNYLPARSYILKIASFKEDNTPARITTLNFVIQPPFYKTWWFYSAAALLLIGILFLLDRERMKRKKAMQNMRSGIADKLHADINQALNNINILSEMAYLKAEEDPLKSKEFIEQIHTRSEKMIVAMDDMLWGISPENDSMAKTMQRIREFLDEQMNRYGVRIDMETGPQTRQPDLPMQLRHEAFLLFKESINGLLKAGATDIRIYLGQDKSWLLYMIEFNTRQCDIKELEHFLSNKEIKEKLEEIGAKLDVFVQKSHSVLECRIPIGT